MPALSLRKLDAVPVGFERGHRPLPRLVVRRLAGQSLRLTRAASETPTTSATVPQPAGSAATLGCIVDACAKEAKETASRIPLGRMRDKNYSRKKMTSDLEALELRHRRGHDTRRTRISLALEDGADKFKLELCTHTPRKKDRAIEDRAARSSRRCSLQVSLQSPVNSLNH